MLKQHFPTKFPQLAVLYEQRWRRGNAWIISNDEEKPCFNLRSQNDSSSPIAKTISSIDLRGSCVHLYENINCTGVKVKLTSEDNATCFHELGYRGCRGTVTVASLEFCNVNFQPSGKQVVMETSTTAAVLTESCRKHNSCISCVMSGCIFPGFKSFPCRHSWDNIVGDYPYNPPIMTTSDCFNLHSRYSTTDKPLNLSIGSLSRQDRDSPGFNAWVVIAPIAVLCVISGISYIIITKYWSRRMDSLTVTYTKSLI
ncbi:unnamed protein product [Allacma fusca]|uniref:Uncharacterized protein n=1 Tax=Allacma fusca TaxID=39272 RepID=A0A8J2PKF0_9HEXA|nr:unnamed protein product [Allacma fusca]